MTRLALLLGVCAAAAPAAPVTLAPATHAAVVAAVRARMGADADVQVVALGAPVPAVAAVSDAVLEPGASIGTPLRVALRAPTWWASCATAAWRCARSSWPSIPAASATGCA
jgi:hypothetical protein